MWQVIFMDGRAHPKEAYDLPTWLGHSVGHWEGDTLVVDTVGFNEGHWLSVNGLPRTSELHLVERFTRPDYNTLRYEATIDDPGAYTRAVESGLEPELGPRPGALREHLHREQQVSNPLSD